MNRRIIVVGASLGGVEALLRLARTLAPDIAAAIVIVSHVGAHRSHLPELLQSRTALTVSFARTGSAPLPGHVYVAPPDHHVLLEGRLLRLFRGPKEHHARPAINPLFRSAALNYGPLAIGVILTGMLDDGAAGLQAIRACGGTTVVQDPDDARAPSMPLAALAAGPVDHVVRLARLGSLLNSLATPLLEVPPVKAPKSLRIEHGISLGSGSLESLADMAKPAGYSCPECGGALYEICDHHPLRFLCHTGHAFSLRSLLQAHGSASEEALWTSVRVLQEKIALLKRIAAGDPTRNSETAAQALAEAEQLSGIVRQMKSLLAEVPSSIDLVEGEAYGVEEAPSD